LKQIRTFTTKKQIQEELQAVHNQGLRIGFVPTMGALHQGHTSLVELARESCDVVVCSIFVNPIQFNDPSDFAKYPKTLDKDLEQLQVAGCDMVYLPSVEEMYPSGIHAVPHYALGQLEALWEGEHRSGHFQGVCAVVQRLLAAVSPHALFMGIKDYQQVAVIRHVLKTLPTVPPVTLIVGDTVRESSGLAMSSRNTRLSAKHRLQAAAIYQGFLSIRKSLDNGAILHPIELSTNFRQSLLAAGFDSVDYIACCDPDTLEPLQQLDKTFVILVAATIGGVRLIDNHTFEL
jgi:pantoate--beta-alanine ligase